MRLSRRAIMRHAVAGSAQVAVVGLLAACQTAPPPTPPPAVGTRPASTPDLSPPSAAQATTTAALATAQARARQSGPRRRLWLVTGSTGGAEELYGRGIAQSITDKFDGYEGSVEVTTGSLMNLAFLARRQADLALVAVDAASEALDGRGPVGAVPVRSLARLYPNYLHLVTLAGGVRTVADLRGRPVALGPPGSPTEFVAYRALAAAGLDPATQVVPSALGPVEAALALRDHAIAAFFWLGPLPATPVRMLAERADTLIRLLPLAEVAGVLTDRYSRVYRAAAIPAGTYAGQPDPVPTLTVDMLLTAGLALEERVAYGVTAAIFANLQELPFFHPEGRLLTLLTAIQTAPVPFHPGAARFYREKGVLPSA